MAEIDAVIMASGRSLRMGSNKLLLPFGDYFETTLLGYFLQDFPFTIFHQVILVCADPQVASIAEKFSLTVIHNDAAQQGQSESIKRGVANSTARDGILFLVADQPFLGGGTIKSIVETFTHHLNSIIIPYVDEKPKNPVLFPAVLREQFQLLEGDVGGREVIQTHPELVHLLPFPAGDDFCDIDDPATYQRMKKRFK